MLFFQTQLLFCSLGLFFFNFDLSNRLHQLRRVYQRGPAGPLAAQHAEAGHESCRMGDGTEEKECTLLKHQSTLACFHTGKWRTIRAKLQLKSRTNKKECIKERQ